MSNLDAIKRITEKLRYTETKIAESSDERVNYWREQDCEAFRLSISALEYAEAMREYEASQVCRD